MPKIVGGIMLNLEYASVEDIQPGKWFWLKLATAFNGEGGISCPAKVQSINDKEVSLMIFGEDFGIGGAKRGQVARILLRDIKRRGAGIFKFDPQKMTVHVAKEIEWVHSQEKFLANYLKELQSAPK